MAVTPPDPVSEAVPRVSVLMAVHNGERHLPEALDTLLAQTLADFELVVVDDASTDGTAAILDAYAARDGRLVVVRNGENLRLPASLNRGLALCRAPLVARADADDVYLPERLERQVAFLDRHPEVGLVGCWYHWIDEDGARQGTSRPVVDHDAISARQHFASSFLHPGVVFRASVVREVGGYDEAYWTAQDSDLWVRLRGRTRFANVPVPLVSYRLHETTISETRGAAGRTLSVGVSRHLLAEALGRPVSDRENEAIVSLYRAWERTDAGDIGLGLPLLMGVLRSIRRGARGDAWDVIRKEAAASLRGELLAPRPLSRPLAASLLFAISRLDPRLLRTRRVASAAYGHLRSGGVAGRVLA